jgi:hypothetical protein
LRSTSECQTQRGLDNPLESHPAVIINPHSDIVQRQPFRRSGRDFGLWRLRLNGYDVMIRGNVMAPQLPACLCTICRRWRR